MAGTDVKASATGSDEGEHQLLPSERQQLIIQRALLEPVVRVKALADELGVHEVTIRRDFEVLAEQGALERVHGGARIVNQAGLESSFQLRVMRHAHEKALIARAARRLIGEGDTVAFDASTSALAVMRAITQQNVQAITISLDGAETLAGAGIPFILLGGTFHPPARSFVGPLVRLQLDRLHPDVAIVSAKGYSPASGFTDAYLPEAETKERLIAASSRVIVVLDHSKMGKQALGTFARESDVHVLVTDRLPAADLAEALEAAGVEIIVAGRGG
jgi:DeoR/GlpR family transcriptional regulator of sugar metabolism